MLLTLLTVALAWAAVDLGVLLVTTHLRGAAGNGSGDDGGSPVQGEAFGRRNRSDAPVFAGAFRTSVKRS